MSTYEELTLIVAVALLIVSLMLLHSGFLNQIACPAMWFIW